MKKLFLISLIIVQSCIAFAQNYCVNDTIVREIQFPLTLQDCKYSLKSGPGLSFKNGPPRGA